MQHRPTANVVQTRSMSFGHAGQKLAQLAELEPLVVYKLMLQNLMLSPCHAMMLGPCWAHLGLLWRCGNVGPCWAYVLY